MSSAKTSKTAVKIVFGAMAIGKPSMFKKPPGSSEKALTSLPDTFHARVTTPEDAALLIELFQKHGHDEVDTARAYGDGTAEELLAEIHWQKRGIVLDTKLYPTKGRPKMSESGREYSHAAEDVRRGLMDSLRALKTDKVNLFYLHAPDRSVPFEETLGAVNALYKEGYFNQFGLSNFMSWEVAQVCEIWRESTMFCSAPSKSIWSPASAITAFLCMVSSH